MYAGTPRRGTIEMELKILSKTENELKLEVIGETHTFCNLLQQFLLEDLSVEVTGYTVPHPLIASPVVYIRTKKGKNPWTHLKEPLKRSIGRVKTS